MFFLALLGFLTSLCLATILLVVSAGPVFLLIHSATTSVGDFVRSHCSEPNFNQHHPFSSAAERIQVLERQLFSKNQENEQLHERVEYLEDQVEDLYVTKSHNTTLSNANTKPPQHETPATTAIAFPKSSQTEGSTMAPIIDSQRSPPASFITVKTAPTGSGAHQDATELVENAQTVLKKVQGQVEQLSEQVERAETVLDAQRHENISSTRFIAAVTPMIQQYCGTNDINITTLDTRIAHALDRLDGLILPDGKLRLDGDGAPATRGTATSIDSRLDQLESKFNDKIQQLDDHWEDEVKRLQTSNHNDILQLQVSNQREIQKLQVARRVENRKNWVSQRRAVRKLQATGRNAIQQLHESHGEGIKRLDAALRDEANKRILAEHEVVKLQATHREQVQQLHQLLQEETTSRVWTQTKLHKLGIDHTKAAPVNPTSNSVRQHRRSVSFSQIQSPSPPAPSNGLHKFIHLPGADIPRVGTWRDTVPRTPLNVGLATPFARRVSGFVARV